MLSFCNGNAPLVGGIVSLMSSIAQSLSTPWRHFDIERAQFLAIAPFGLHKPCCHYIQWQDCSLQGRHNGRDGVSNHQRHHCFLNRLFGSRSKKTSIKAQRHWPLWGEFTNGQERGKCFYLMTSSCDNLSYTYIYYIYIYIYPRMRYNFLWVISMAWHIQTIYQHTTVTINIHTSSWYSDQCPLLLTWFNFNPSMDK